MVIFEIKALQRIRMAKIVATVSEYTHTTHHNKTNQQKETETQKKKQK